jgi:hypothetical protein
MTLYVEGILTSGYILFEIFAPLISQPSEEIQQIYNSTLPAVPLLHLSIHDFLAVNKCDEQTPPLGELVILNND